MSKASSGTRLPYEIRETMITAAQQASWDKQPLLALLRAAGVPETLIARHAEEPKKWLMRSVLDELDAAGDDGYLIQRRILTEQCKLRGPHDSAMDRDAAVQALRRLKELAAAQRLWVEGERTTGDTRRAGAERQVAAAMERQAKMDQLRHNFAAMASGGDPQRRGYDLQGLLRDLFTLNEIPYRSSSRTTTDEVDGSFEYRHVPYLVEARWRKECPGQADLAAFVTKVEQRLQGTRGLFLSMAGFRPEVVEMFDRRGNGILLMDGQDLALIVEGQVGLTEALDLKLRRASTYGQIYFRLTDR